MTKARPVVVSGRGRTPRATMGLATAALLCACLEPRPDTARYYALTAAPRPAPAAPGGVGGSPAVTVLGLGPVLLPPYLDRPELATRVGPDEIAYSGQDRWAAPLDELVRRALAEELRARVPVGEVVAWPWSRGEAPPLSVSVEVLRFERQADGLAVLVARWRVAGRGDGPPRAAGETHARESWRVGDPASSVAALDRCLAMLADDVAAGVAAARH